MSDNKVITDVDGRKLSIRALTPSQFMDLLEAAGKCSQNTGYLQFATQVFSVADIDGVPLPVPSDQRQLRINADKIGVKGMEAIFANNRAMLEAAMAVAKDGENIVSEEQQALELAKN